MGVDEEKTVLLVPIRRMAGEVDLLDLRERVGVDIGEGVPALVGGRDEHVVDVEQEAAAGAPRDLGDEVGFRIGALGEGQIRGGVLQQHLPAERVLHRVDVLADAGEGACGVRHRQQVVQESGIVARPGEMLGEQGRRVTGDERLQPCEMLRVEGPVRADRQSHTVQRQRVAFAHHREIAMRRTAGPHVVFRVNLEEADLWPCLDHGAVMLGLQPDTGAMGHRGRIGRGADLGHGRPPRRWGEAGSMTRPVGGPPGGAPHTLGVRLPGPFGVEMLVQVPVGTSLKALPW